jgi:hypothetical protein
MNGRCKSDPNISSKKFSYTEGGWREHNNTSTSRNSLAGPEASLTGGTALGGGGRPLVDAGFSKILMVSCGIVRVLKDF